MNSLKMSPLGSCWCRATPLHGDIINERRGTETNGGAGGSEAREAECGWGRTADAGVLPASQADLAAFQASGGLGSGTSESGQARTATQGGEIACSGAGPIPAALSGFRPHTGSGKAAAGRDEGGSRDTAALA